MSGTRVQQSHQRFGRAMSPGRLFAWGMAGILVLVVVQMWFTGLTAPWVHWPALGADYTMHRDAAERWLQNGVFYLPRQLAGPYDVVYPDVLYPPTILVLLIPFTILPAALWWIVPLTITAWAIARNRPSPLGWVLTGALLAWPMGLALMIRVGNPVMWAMAALSVATIRPGFAPLVLIKPTLAPFALFGVRSRGWWVGLAAAAALSALFLPMWIDYARVILDARNEAGLLYSWQQASLMLAPILAWWTGSRRRESNGRAAASAEH